jgi:hypothetical protein
MCARNFFSMLDLFTLIGAVGLESEVLETRQTVTGQARGNIFNQSQSSSEASSAEEESSIHKMILSLLSALPDTPTLEVPKAAKTA